MELTEEQLLVGSLFWKNFGGHHPRPVVLYGLGRNTKAILALHPEAVSGVMGPDADGASWHGKTVLQEEEAAAMQADIVLVARDAILPVIYRRIAWLEGKGVRIYRLDGHRAGAARAYGNADLPYWKMSLDMLKERMGQFRHISFDIFDTLLTRRVLRPEDIYLLVERRLPFFCRGFADARRKSQEEMGICATIRGIYRIIGERMNLSDEEQKQAMDVEWEVEREQCFPRKDMREAFLYALEQGQSVWLLSDMYWPSERLRELLAIHGMASDVPILVSCENGCSKEDGGLYREYLRKLRAKAGECLHIGDNRYADVEAAERAGMASFQLYSGYRMLEESAAQALLEHEGKGSIALGGFVAERFSSPFALAGKQGRISVKTPYELGHDFIAPLMDCQMAWLQQQLKEDNLESMLFPSRDGYLPFQLYQMLRQEDSKLPKGIYFKASRRAVAMASVRREEDVIALAGRGFHGTAKEFFFQRFGIVTEEACPWDFDEKASRGLLKKYLPKILEQAAKERTCYLRYLNTLGLPSEGKCGFFDFVAGGTVQHFYEKLTGCRTKGFYFATMNLPNSFYQIGDIAATFGNITSYASASPLSEGYLMLESILTDPDPSLVCFGEEGCPVFEAAENPAWSVMEQVQHGILDAVRERMQRGEAPAEQEVALSIWKLLLGGQCIVSEKLREWFRHEDSYDGAARAEACWVAFGGKEDDCGESVFCRMYSGA